MPAWTNASGRPTATGAGVLRPEELARHVRLDRVPCDPRLDPVVENHWSLRWDLPAGTSFASSTLPHPACTLSVERGHTRPEVGAEAVVVTGVPTRRFDVTLRGSGWVHGVKLRPGGLTALTGVRARDLTDRTVPATGVLPVAVVEALARLDASVPAEECGAAADAALAPLVGEPDPDHAVVLEVVAAMLDDRGLTQVAQVEERLGIGTRRLQRLFAHYVGVSPKWVLSRYRMHDVVTALDQGYAGSLADLAATYGWFDQAHFTREFTRLVGVPPGRYQRPAR